MNCSKIGHIIHMANQAFKYRMYPNIEQQILFAKTFGCCRKVYNLMLSDKKTCYQQTGSFGIQTPAMYKDQYPFLKEVDSLALANVQLNMQNAIRSCFDQTRKKRNRFPKFKSKHKSRRSYTTNNQNGTIAIVDDQWIRLPKLGYIKAVIHRLPPEDWKLKSATVSKEADGSYYCSVLYEYEETITQVQNPEQNAIGLDYKSDGLYADSEGNICGSPKYFRTSERRLARAQKKLSRKQQGSNNYHKQKIRVAKIHRHVANQRKDHLHKHSTAIAKQYDMVCVEDLNMQAMSNRGFGNGKTTLDNGYGMFLTMLEYKLRNQGKVLIRVDKWFPSSQMCSNCGTVHLEVKNLSMRKWTCSDCGTTHDRDHNAAINIKQEGIRQFLAG